MPVDTQVERKLAAIMVADVEGHSRKMHENEEMRRWRPSRRIAPSPTS
jgi:hypothetical protein